MALDRFQVLKSDMGSSDLADAGHVGSLNLGRRFKKVKPGATVQKADADLALALWPNKIVPWQEVQKVDRELVLALMPDAVFESMSTVLKANPYHAADGAFASKDRAAMVAWGGKKIPIGRAKELTGKDRDAALSMFNSGSGVAVEHQASGTEVKHKSKAVSHKEVVDAATYSGGQYKEHSKTYAENHSSRSIRVPDEDKKKVLDRAERALEDAGMKFKRKDTLTGASQYASESHTGEVWHNNGVVHVTMKKKSS
jgi:SHS2 domain-containing protein